MYFFKSTADPLSLISQLDTLMIISSNQIVKQSFIEKSKASEGFIELEQDQQDMLLELWK